MHEAVIFIPFIVSFEAFMSTSYAIVSIIAQRQAKGSLMSYFLQLEIGVCLRDKESCGKLFKQFIH